MKQISTFQDILFDQLGPYVQIRDTSIDDVSLNKAAFFKNEYSNRQIGKSSFVASFPLSHNSDWFAQIKLLKMRDSLTDKHEVKWKWFDRARNRMDRKIVENTYSRLGEAMIFINDLAPFMNEYEQILTSIGIEPEAIKTHPYFYRECLQYASESLIFQTPLYEIHTFDPFMIHPGYVPIDSDDHEKFHPKTYLENINGKKGITPQNVLQFTGEIQASFQELMDPNTSP